jgi:hypothetical protein
MSKYIDGFNEVFGDGIDRNSIVDLKITYHLALS